MSITPQFLDELRSRLTLSEVIGRWVKLTRAGRESKGCCPFHHEKTPSFTVNDEKQFYHCFGCGAHGDVIGFIIEHRNLSFIDAVEMLAAEAGLQVPQQSLKEVARAKEAKDLYALLDEVTNYFEKCLNSPQHQDALNYLLGRGFSRDIIKQFRLGFSPEDGQALRKFLSANGYSDSDMIKAGVLRSSTRGGEPYAFFRDRVMFPVPDRRGRTVAFGGRILPEHIRPPSRSDFTPPKYINSAETTLFHKGKMLYGEPMARRAAADDQDLIVVEGYLDVIACAQAGVMGAVAPMGTALTKEQILSLWAMFPGGDKVPILCFDGDNAGRRAAIRVCDSILPLLAPGKSVGFAFLPDGEDPDSLIKDAGIAGFKKIIGSSMSLLDFIWNIHVSGRAFKTPEARAGVIKILDGEVAKISDENVSVHYKSLLRQKVSDTFFPRRVGFKGGKSQNQLMAAMRPQSPQIRAKFLFERVLLAAIINHPNIYEGVEERLCELSFNSSSLVRLCQLLEVYLADEVGVTSDILVKYLNDSGFSQEVNDICNESVYVHASFCSPSAKVEEVEANWLEYWKDGSASGLDREIQSRWKRAYIDSSEEEEEKLRALLSMKESGKE